MQDLSTTQRERLLTTKEAAQILNYKPKTLEEWRQRGDGPKYLSVSPRSVRYRPEDLDEWIEEKLRSSTSDPGPETAS